MIDDIPMGSVGPDDDDDEPFIPKQAPKVDLPEEVKQEIEFIYTFGSRKISNAMAVLEDENRMSFILNDFLPKMGLAYVGGLSGTGKTILGIQVIANLVLGKSTMSWGIGEEYKDRHLRVLMLSLEMNRVQLQRRLEHMFPNLSEEEQKLFRENFLTYDEPEAFELWNFAHVLELAKIIKSCKVDVVLIDSASVSFGESLKDDVQVNQSIKNLYKIRARVGFACIIVAHTRKPPPGIASNPEDVTLNELFGHSGVAQSADAIFIMVEDEKYRKSIIKDGNEKNAEKLVHIVNAKNRFGANTGSFKSHLTSMKDVEKGHPLMFKRNAIPIEMTDEQKRKLAKKPAGSMADIMAGIDFGAIGEGD